MAMDVVSGFCAFMTIGCAATRATKSQSTGARFSRSRGLVWSDLKKKSVVFSAGFDLNVGESWKQGKCSGSQFGIRAEVSAKAGDDNARSQLKISGENGKAPSGNAKSEKRNGASQSKSSFENGAVKASEPYAQTTSSDEIECNGANSNRSGLFRTPISGGVQSATSSHNLPAPAVAVRNLIEQAQFAHLCTVMSRMHHRRQGYPFGSFVDFAPDDSGHLIFSFSSLAIHTRNLLSDPRCTVVIQLPGSSGLGNARVTIFGDVYPVSKDQQALAHKIFSEKHQHSPSHQWGNYTHYYMENISDIYFVGGFGTVAWVDVKEYEKAKPDVIAVKGAENILKELNAKYSKPLREVLNTEVEVDDVALISIDSKGADIRVRQGLQFNVQRVSFDEVHAVETLEQAKNALQNALDRVHACLAYAE